MKEQGLQLVDRTAAVQLFRDPRFQEGRIVFIDARDEAHYREGHIPGAYEFDPYHPEKYFPTALARSARRRNKSWFTAMAETVTTASLPRLRSATSALPIKKLFIYGGGITEWTTNGLPVEIGERNSGKLRRTGQ